MNSVKDWYPINDLDKLDSPALVIYLQRVKENIKTLVSMIDDVARLRPHVKTHKAKEAVLLCMEAGIIKFKCATIAEAEMLGICGAPDVLFAYQPSVPKLERLLRMIKKYPVTKFSCLVDNLDSATHVAKLAVANELVVPVYMDMNIGMNRTGIRPGQAAIDLYQVCSLLTGIELKGLHAYDGHIHDTDPVKRAAICEAAYAPVEKMKEMLIESGYPTPVIIAGGSPTFPMHAARGEVECSPGTFIYWDKGYLDTLPDQEFLPAALVITRVISLPGDTTLCLDLGHKSVAAENALNHRVSFLNAPELVMIGQSEEHLVVDAGIGHTWKIGDVLYGIPVHVCPTIALYDTATIIEDHTVTGSWKIIARDRKINV